MRPSSPVFGHVTYDLAAARRYERCVEPRFAPLAECLASEAVAHAPESVLEIAAGTGALTRQLAARLDQGARLLVTDRFPAMLEIAEERPAGSPSVTFRQLDYEKPLPFDSGSVDLVASQFGYLHTSLEGLRECARVLRPGGRLHVAFWGEDYLELEILSKARERVGLPPIRPTTIAWTEALLRRAGLQVETVAGVEFPARFEDAREYVEYRHALGLPEDPVARDRNLAVLEIARQLMEAEFGPGSPIAFWWRASLMGARLANQGQ